MTHENKAVNFEIMMMHIDIIVQTRYNNFRTLALSCLGGYEHVLDKRPTLVGLLFFHIMLAETNYM